MAGSFLSNFNQEEQDELREFAASPTPGTLADMDQSLAAELHRMERMVKLFRAVREDLNEPVAMYAILKMLDRAPLKAIKSSYVAAIKALSDSDWRVSDE